jgi:NAD(P)-dependent dehydrogenase (short-subunit alcohol dehydrogenase family)
VTKTDDTAVPDYRAMARLDGRQFVVLGAGQGIGRQCAHALTQAGARVFCVDRNAELAQDIAAEVGGIGHACDATRRAESERLFAEAEKQMGRIDGLVDIIGQGLWASLDAMDDKTWDDSHDIVLRHAFYAMQYGSKAMRRAGGGSMVFISSIAGFDSSPWHAAYGAFKAGLMSMVRSAAFEFGPHNIRVNAVAPGAVWTPRISARLGEAGRRMMEENAPLRRIALPANIASAVLFFCSDLSDAITGNTIIADDGVHVNWPYPEAPQDPELRKGKGSS